MAIVSVFDIFKIGIGPSSSHTVGPMKAATAFASSLDTMAPGCARIRVTLHGSLALTGRGHGTDSAIILGLLGKRPESIDPDDVKPLVDTVVRTRRIHTPAYDLAFDPSRDLVFDYENELPRHTNGMRFEAISESGKSLAQEDYYSLGGGFIARGDESESPGSGDDPPYPFDDAKSMLAMAARHKLTIAELTARNELHWRDAGEVDSRLAAIWQAMQACIERGLHSDGILPGRLNVSRRAPRLYRRLTERKAESLPDAMEWVNAYAIAVNEENAAGGRVVTSPTNGAAGIIPAVLRYYVQFMQGACDEGVRSFLLTAGTIGILYKTKASISGAEMGCQGEVGVACSMAAAGLAAVLGGTNDHIEEAAEIGMEHNLGLTCDPIGGLVQIPCIERNAMGAVKAINAARLAMHGDGTHKVSLDQVIETMRQTGLDMSSSYKETSRGGLAVNVPEC